MNVFIDTHGIKHQHSSALWNSAVETFTPALGFDGFMNLFEESCELNIEEKIEEESEEEDDLDPMDLYHIPNDSF